MPVIEFTKRVEVAKVDAEHGLVFGWAIITKIHGKPYYDTHGDHITDPAMLEAVTDFAMSKRTHGEMHVRDEDGNPVSVGTVVHLFPLTDDVAAAFGIECEKRGLLVAAKPTQDVLEKFRNGEYTGFSIGGEYIDYDPEDAA